EHDIDIQTAWAEQVEAVDFEEKGNGGAQFQFDHGGVEALQMADLEDAGVALGGADQPGGGVKVGGNRLLDQNVDSRLEQRRRDLLMDRGGSRDDRGIHLS